MPGPGRPRLGAEKLTSAQRKERWDKLQRNKDGSNLEEPERKPVTIYLCEEALEVLRKTRGDSRLLGKGSLRDSHLVEDLLLKRLGSTEGVEADVNLIEELRAAVARLDKDAEYWKKTAKFEQNRARTIDPQLLADECIRRSDAQGTHHLDKLAEALLPLLMYPTTSGYHLKFRRRLEEYFERLFGVQRTLSSKKAPD